LNEELKKSGALPDSFVHIRSDLPPPPGFKLGKIAFLRHKARSIVESKVVCCKEREFILFDYIVGAVILFNAICVGIESNLSLQNLNMDPEEIAYNLQTLENLEYVFLSIYYVELFLRFFAGGWRIFSRVIAFDILLVLLGTVAVLHSHLMAAGLTNGSGGSLAQKLEPILVLRVLRLLRLLRALRMVKYFKTLWRLVNGLVHTTSTMISTFVLLLLTIYISACMAIEIISKDSVLRSAEETRVILDYSFSSLGTVMITFVQFVTMDSIASIYLPLVKRRRWLCVFFGLLIVIISVALMNLVTAVLVETAIENSKKDQDFAAQRIRRLRPQLKKAFRLMDVDGSRTVSREEVVASHSHFPSAVLKSVPRGSLPDLFDMLDSDGTGEIGEETFVEGVMEFILSDLSFTAMQELKLLAQMRSWQQSTTTQLSCIHERLKQLKNIAKSRSNSNIISPKQVPSPKWSPELVDDESVANLKAATN